MTQNARGMTTHTQSLAGTEGSDPATSTAPPLPAAGMVKILERDERHLEVRYYDVPDKYRVWLLPREDAQDFVRWWIEQGADQSLRSGKLPEQKFGRIFVSLLSRTQVYCGGSNPLGGPNVTGYQFPRVVVEALAVHMREVHNRRPQADTETIGDTP